jgi:hypothetical protein
MNFFQRRKILKEANAFNLIPIRLMQHEVNESSMVAILIPKFSNPFTKKYFEPMLKHSHIKMKLDEIGSAVWLAIDDKKNLGAMANELVLRFGEKIQPIEERLPKFISQLYEQRYITFQEIKGV